eukprot:1870574-Pleurochrysis_carterae.AAC.2
MDEALSSARQFRSLGTKVDSTNRKNVSRLSAEQCSRVVESGYKKQYLSAFSGSGGLANVQHAVHAIGGRIWLRG